MTVFRRAGQQQKGRRHIAVIRCVISFWRQTDDKHHNYRQEEEKPDKKAAPKPNKSIQSMPSSSAKMTEGINCIESICSAAFCFSLLPLRRRNYTKKEQFYNFIICIDLSPVNGQLFQFIRSNFVCYIQQNQYRKASAFFGVLCAGSRPCAICENAHCRRAAPVFQAAIRAASR